MSEQKLPHKVLIVEDEEVSQKVLLALFGRLQVTPTIATNAKEARAALNNESFDLVLMDIMLPELSGLEITKEFRIKEATLNRRTLIVAITSLDSKEDKQRCLEAGMDGYFAKPINRVMFLDFLKNLLK
jgi:CheY-like chemotaxis protein